MAGANSFSASSATTSPQVTSSASMIPLPEGVYSLTARTQGPTVPSSLNITLPAVQILSAPSRKSTGTLELVAAPNLHGTWLVRGGDTILAHAKGGTCHVMVVSLSMPGESVLAIDVKRLDAPEMPAGAVRKSSLMRPVAPRPEQPAATRDVSDAFRRNFQQRSATTPPTLADGHRMLRTAVAAHIQNQGDAEFYDGGWAGNVEKRAQIEAFAIAIGDELRPGDIQYKAMTATGTETPWMSGGEWCGSRGQGIALTGITVRLKPGPASRFICDYSGMFRSGATTGPIKDGLPCRSPNPDDPLIAIQFRIIERHRSFRTEVKEQDAPMPAAAPAETAKPAKTHTKWIWTKGGASRE